MVLEALDRTQWSFAQALAHVERVVLTTRERQVRDGVIPPPAPVPAWRQEVDAQTRWKAEAQEQLLVALRDGDLHAQGRFSENPSSSSWGADYGRSFVLHSGHHTPISPTQWREGRWLNGALSAMFWQFIDIRMPRFVVRAIWPEPGAAAPGAYTTPYLDLMQAAIAHFRLTDADQAKKDVIVDWLLTQTIEGEPISQNLADAMATLIRLPSSQRGGARRPLGPEFSRAS